MKVELCNKSRFKNVTGVDTSDFAKNTDLADLKSDVDILDIEELKNWFMQFEK